MHFSANELHYEFIIGKLAARGGRRGSIPSRGQMLDSGGSLVAQMLEQDVGKFTAGTCSKVHIRLNKGFPVADRLTGASPGALGTRSTS